MKVLAINSSPRGDGTSKTGIMLNHMIDGMQEEGATVDLINIARKKIKYCTGCFTCWTKTPGACVHHDDMSKEIFAKFISCDLLVMATPIYHFTQTAYLKTFIERTVPIQMPFWIKESRGTRHPLRHKEPPTAVLAVAGFHEYSVFDQISSYMNFLYGDLLIAEIYRTNSEFIGLLNHNQLVQDACEATKKAGQELIRNGKVSLETKAKAEQPFCEDYSTVESVVNAFWNTCIAEKMNPNEFRKKGGIIRPDTLDNFLYLAQLGFNPQKDRNLEVACQYRFSGEVQGDCYFIIKDGKLQTGLGRIDNPDLTILAPFELWMDIYTKKVSAQQMYLARRFQVQGDINMLLRLGSIFGK